jgi:valyl-tRNA synthetase
MTRYERLRGKETLFVPGSDHAGIATQNVVERELNKKGINRKEIGREAFIEKVWEWKDEYHARITEQSKRMGMSCDWSRERFTLDENLSRAVREAFVRLFKRGLIYRGNYMVNWCPGRCESAISDLEAIPEDEESNLWYIRYPVITDEWQGPAGEWGSGTWAEGATTFIEVATTRPETLLGDTGVATTEMHPAYGPLIGKIAVLPVLGREIPIFSDELVDPEFGTGAVKVTPAHDPNDYIMGQRHGLEAITVMDVKGAMLPEYSGKYAGMDRFECRDAIVEDLQLESLLVKIDPYSHAVARCQRCNTVIEPRISTQWFVKTKGLADAVIERVRNGDSIIMPEREERRFYQWMENIKDWCISRQLWWGHRIPVWYCPDGHETSEIEDPQACSTCGSTDIHQDEDVLDTWFSSGLWPFSTLGWPDTENPDFVRFYPTDMRETGYDILFFWVAREMMLGVELTGEVPYKWIYLHGIVRNEDGKKISKSMENIENYNPLNIIKDYGCDPLRYMLVSNAVPGQDINLDFRQLEAAKRFCNKVWQSTKFVLGNIAEDEEVPRFSSGYPADRLQLADRWILSRFNRIVQETTAANEDHDYLTAARIVKNFIWDEFCDWYIEASKVRLYDEQEEDKLTPKVVLLHVLEGILTMLHPIVPHLTEALWQALPSTIKEGPALIVGHWPEPDASLIDDEIEANFGMAIVLVNNIRSLRSTFNVPASAKIPLFVDAPGKENIIEQMKGEIAAIARLDTDQVVISAGLEAPPHAARIVFSGVTAFLPLEGLIDVESERARMEKELTKTERAANSTRSKLAGQFSQKAPPEVVAAENEKLAGLDEKIAKLKEQIEILQ